MVHDASLTHAQRERSNIGDAARTDILVFKPHGLNRGLACVGDGVPLKRPLSSQQDCISLALRAP